LIAAAFTPMRSDGSLDLDVVPAVCDFVLGRGADGLFLCGSTGEFPSLSVEERKEVARAYVDATAGRAPVAVHVGHSSLADARALAAHAACIGADAIAVAPPSYYAISSVERLVECLRHVAEGAPETPLYYYHIPRLTGVDLPMSELLERADQALPSFAGIKFSSFELDDLLCCVRYGEGRYQILFGADEMLLAGLAMGAAGAVGSTYNFLAPLYRRVIEAFEEGRVEEAQAHQFAVTSIVRTILSHGGHDALKAAMGILGVGCGPPRLPYAPLSAAEMGALAEELTEAMARETAR